MKLVGYMLGPFLDALANFSVATVERVVGDRLSPNYVLPKADIKAVVRQFEQTMQSRNEDLRRLWISDDSQLSPKRRATEEEPDPRFDLHKSCPQMLLTHTP